MTFRLSILIARTKKNTANHNDLRCFFTTIMVPGAGLEPARYC